MAKLRYHTIIAGLARKNDPQTIDAPTAEAIQPGALVFLDAGKLKKHATAGKSTQALVMQTNYIAGGDIRNDVPLGATGVAVICEQDVDYYVRVKQGESLKVGDKLTSNGDGTLKKAGASDEAIFIARETYTVASDGVELVKVRKA